jgi:hypothetical protein
MDSFAGYKGPDREAVYLCLTKQTGSDMYIQDVGDSDLSHDTSYPHWGSSRYSSGKYLDSTLN